MIARSLGAAASGVEAMQTALDEIGNDIANSSTDGFKSGTAEFEDLLTQQLNPAVVSGSPDNPTTTNPTAVGSGVAVAGVSTDFSEGTITQTGVATNVAIAGAGFLVVDNGGTISYTRDGDLQLDSGGHLVTSNGGQVLGYLPGQSATSSPVPLSIIQGSAEAPNQTLNINMGGNLPPANGGTNPVTISTSIFDSLGNQVPVTLTLTPTGTANTWSLQGTVTGASANLWTNPQTVTFGTDGQLADINGNAVGTGSTSLAIGNLPSNFTWSAGAPSIVFPPVGSQNALTQFNGDDTAGVVSQDGYAAGTMQSFAINGDGTISATYSNGHIQSVGQIALASFVNPGGLTDQGNSFYIPTTASGTARYGVAGTGGLGKLEGGAVEGSNVNLASELTDLIEVQTAYQANTKVVDSSSSALQSLIQMA